MKNLSLFSLVIIGVCATAFGASEGVTQFYGMSIIGSMLGVGIAGAGCGIGMGICISSALQGIARQPEITSKLQINMILGIVFIETLVLYAMVLAFIILFANPYAKLVS
ncbi:MAG: ATP synthase F0 subunit C [Chitinivibrionales bacterium]|nr:ATP synthase F0 subunit C [Chitinivibrionales bacterium]